MITFGNHEHGHLIAKAAETHYNPECDQCISISHDGLLYGGVIYQNYTKASIGMHTAGFSPGWATRDFMWAIFHYPFEQLGCKKVFGQVRETNTRALEIDLKIGFKIIAKVEDVFPDGACILVGMAREECRWLKLKPRTLKPGSETGHGW